MSDLANRKLKTYQKDEKPLTVNEVADLLPSLPDWEVVEREGIPRLEKSYKFPDFSKALDFANLVGKIAEEGDHHPAILISWGRTAVSWWTHAVNGLHENDFIMAARTEELFQENDPSGEG